MLSAPRAFARCTECSHAGVMRAAAACAACGGETRAETPPADLYEAWRCGCDHCTSTPC